MMTEAYVSREARLGGDAYTLSLSHSTIKIDEDNNKDVAAKGL
jgi:hypothetical protein